jgi:hypothetical protein
MLSSAGWDISRVPLIDVEPRSMFGMIMIKFLARRVIDSDGTQRLADPDFARRVRVAGVESWITPDSDDAGLLEAITRPTLMSMVQNTDRKTATVLSSDASWFSTTRLMQCLALDAHTDVVGNDDNEAMQGTGLNHLMSTVAMLMACQDLEANLREKPHPAVCRGAQRLGRRGPSPRRRRWV